MWSAGHGGPKSHAGSSKLGLLDKTGDRRPIVDSDTSDKTAAVKLPLPATLKSCAFAFLAMNSPAVAANITSTWKSKSGGNFDNPDNWNNSSGGYVAPNNGANTFDAIITLNASPIYNVSIGSPIIINNLTLNTNSTLSQGSAVYIVDTLTITSGTYSLLNGATLTTGGTNLNGGILNLANGTLTPTNITMNGGTITGGSITTDGAGQLHFASGTNNVLDSVAILGGLLLDTPNSRVRLRNDASFAHSDATLSGSGAILSYEGNSTDHEAWLANSTIHLDSGGATISLDGVSPTLTNAKSGIIHGRGNIHTGQLVTVTGYSHFINQGLVSADVFGQNIVLTPHIVTNSAKFEAIGGGSLFINSPSFTNSTGATISATGASTVTLQKTWHNFGNIILRDTSTLSLEGSFTTADMGISGWDRTGGTVKISGNLDNSGSTLVLNAASGPIVLNGGTIKGGTLTQSAANLVFSNVSTSILDNVGVTDALVIDTANARLRLRNDTSFASATVSGSSSILSFEGTATDQSATLQNSVINLESSGIVSLDGTSPSLTIGPAGVIRGRGTVNYSQLISVTGLSQLINQGLVSADINGNPLTLTPHVVTNTGTFRAINGASLFINSAAFTNSPGGILSATGGSTLSLQKIWHNSGTLILQDTSTVSLEGTFSTADLGMPGWSRSGGNVKLAGTLDNTNATLALTAGTGPVVLNGGTILGGIITQSGTGKLAISGPSFNVLDAVTIHGGLVLDQPNARARFRNAATSTNGISLTGSGATIGFEGTAADHNSTLSDATIAMDGSGATISLDGNAPVLTIASSAVVRGRGSIAPGQLVSVTGTAQIINQGLLSADISGQILALNNLAVTNTGVLEAKNGATLSFSAATATQAAGTFRLAGGTFQINGSVAGADLTVGAAGFLKGYGQIVFANATTDSLVLVGNIDPSPGSGGLIIKGDLIPSAAVTFNFDIAGTSQGSAYDFISEAGSTALALGGSKLKITLAASFTPSASHTFTLLTSNQAITGSFGNVASGARITTTDGRGSFLVTYSGNSVVLSNFIAAPQPGYATWIDGYFPGISDPAIIGPTADPDHDGVPNLLEYAMKGDPTSTSDRGSSYYGFQNIGLGSGPQFTYVIAFRKSAVFSQQPDGSQRNPIAVDSLHCSVQGSVDLANYNQPILKLPPTQTPPAGSNLPNLMTTDWEYHTFYVDPAVISSRVFLRAVIDNQP